MYHLKRSLRSGCGSGCSGGTSNSSAIMLSFPGLRLLRQSAQLLQQPVKTVREDTIHHKEEQAENEDRHENHRRSRLDFLARGRYHLAQLSADIAQKMGEFFPLSNRF